MDKIRESGFARFEDDEDLNDLLKNKLHADDPMAQFLSSKSKSSKGSSGGGAAPSKPRYQGPMGPANRFNIIPGYRWDGVDRGNGFEAKYSNSLNNKGTTKEAEYRYRSADM